MLYFIEFVLYYCLFCDGDCLLKFDSNLFGLNALSVWQPLSIYLLTWMKIWAFHNGLVMEASVYNMGMLCCCCCTKSKRRKITRTDTKRLLEGLDFDKKRTMTGDGDEIDGKDTSHYVTPESSMYEPSMSGSSGSFYRAIDHEDRKLDIVGFLGSDLFVDEPLDGGEFD